jgi:hypothetical protein
MTECTPSHKPAFGRPAPLAFRACTAMHTPTELAQDAHLAILLFLSQPLPDAASLIHHC